MNNASPLPSIWLLATIALASPFAMNVFNPAMPDVVRAFGSRIDIVQLTMTLYLFALGISQLLSGILADRFGRRPLMLGGMLLNLLGTLLAALAPDIAVLIAGRVLQALGGGATLVLVRTMILDAHERNEAGKLLSYITMAIAFAQITAPTIGGYLNHYFGWRTIFYFSFSLNLLISLLMFRQLRETAPPDQHTRFNLPKLLSQYLAVLNSPAYLGYALSGALITCAYLGFTSIMPYIFIDRMEGTSAEYGNWFLLIASGFFSGSLLASHLTTRLGLDRMIVTGLSIALLAASILVIASTRDPLIAITLFLPMGMLTFGRGLVQPNTQSGAISSISTISRSRGTASGLMGFMQLMLATAVTQSMPWILSLGVNWVFVTLWLLLILSGLFHRSALRQQR